MEVNNNSILGTNVETNAQTNVDTNADTNTQTNVETNTQTNVDTNNEIKTYLDNTGKFNEGWQSLLDETIRGDKTLSSITDINQLSKMLVNAQGMIGKKRIALPDEYAEKEVWDEFYKQIGRPEKPEEYELKRNLPEDMPFNEKDNEWFKNTAYELGLSKSQANKLIEKYDEYNSSQFNNMKMMAEETELKAISELKSEWGAEYPIRTKNAVELLKSTGLQDEIVNAGLDNNIAVIKLLDTIASMTKEDQAIGVPFKNNFSTNSLAELQSHPAYMDAKHPLHNDIMNKIKRFAGVA